MRLLCLTSLLLAALSALASDLLTDLPKGKVKSSKLEIALAGKDRGPFLVSSRSLDAKGQLLEIVETNCAALAQSPYAIGGQSLWLFDLANQTSAERIQTTTRYAYDTAGRNAEIVTETLQGNVKSGTRTVTHYGASGRVGRMDHYVNGALVSNTRLFYDARGNNVKTETSAGDRLLSRTTLTINGNGQTMGTLSEYADALGKMTVSRTECKFGDNALIEREASCDGNGDPIYIRDYEYAGTTLRKSTTTTYSHTKGNPGRTVTTYDESGRLTSEEVFDLAGKRVSRQVCAVSGGITNTEFFDYGPTGDLRGRTVTREDAKGTEVWDYDGQGRVTLYRRERIENGRRVSETKSQAKRSLTICDEEGRPLECSRWNAEGELTETGHFAYQFDIRGNWVKITRTDRTGRAVSTATRKIEYWD